MNRAGIRAAAALARSGATVQRQRPFIGPIDHRKGQRGPTAVSQQVYPRRGEGKAPLMAAIQFFDPSFSHGKPMPSLMSVGRTTHIPMVCRFDATLRMPDANTNIEFKKILIITASNTATVCAEWDAQITTNNDPQNNLCTVKYHYFHNVLPSSQLGQNAHGIPTGGGDTPEDVKMSRCATHIQNVSNDFSKGGSVYVRRMAAGYVLPQLNGETFLDHQMPAFELLERRILTDTHTTGHTAANFTREKGICAIPASQANYDSYHKWSRFTIPADNAQPENMTYKDWFNYVSSPTLTVTYILFDRVPYGPNITDQIYRMGIFGDFLARFESGSLLNNSAKPEPVDSAAHINSMRNTLEMMGSSLYEVGTRGNG